MPNIHSLYCKDGNLKPVLYLVNKKTNQGFWYGLKTSLIEKSGADCYYSHQYGEFNPDSNFDLVVGNNYNIEFLGEKYFFSLTSNETGKIVNTSELERKYSNLTFNGTIEGKNAVLSFNENQTISLNVEDKELFSVIFNGYASLPNGGINYNDDIIKIYDGQEGYSYEFNLDLANSTFTVTEYNHLFGLYQLLIASIHQQNSSLMVMEKVLLMDLEMPHIKHLISHIKKKMD